MPCKVRPDGRIECPVVVLALTTEEQSGASDLGEPLRRTFGGDWDGAKLVLAYKMLKELAASDVSDATVAARSKSVIASIRLLLEEEPASVLLFNFSALPRESIGPWMLGVRGIEGVTELYDLFDGGAPYESS